MDAKSTRELCTALEYTRSVTFLDVSGVFDNEPANVLNIIRLTTSILFVKLAKLCINDVCLDLSLVEQLSTALIHNISLCYINFAKNNLTIDMLYTFVKFLATNNNVETLDLSNNAFGLHDCTECLNHRFWDMVSMSTRLRSLLMGGNGLCNHSMNHVALFLQRNTPLALINLSGNMIGSLGMTYLLSVMHMNTRISVVNVYNNINFPIRFSRQISSLVKERICGFNIAQSHRLLQVHGISLHVSAADLDLFNDTLPPAIRLKGLYPTNHVLQNSLLLPNVLLCFFKPILGNRYVRSRGFIVSEPRETHPGSEIADVPTSPCPPLKNLGCPDPHPSP